MADDELIASYIRRHTQPVQWANWWVGEPGHPADDALRPILSDPTTGSLADLTHPAVREAVVVAVLATPYLRQVVGAEVDEILDRVSDLAVRSFARRRRMVLACSVAVGAVAGGASEAAATWASSGAAAIEPAKLAIRALCLAASLPAGLWLYWRFPRGDRRQS